MATRDWPTALAAAELQFYLRKSGAQFKGLTDASLQAVDWMSERWVVACSLPPYQRGSAAHDAAEALANWLPGGVNRVRVWNHARPMPSGSVRGPTFLSGAVAKGGAQLVLKPGRAAPNLAMNPGFLRTFQAVGYGTLPEWWASYNNNQATEPASYQVASGAPSGGNFVRVTSTNGGTTNGWGIARSGGSLDFVWRAHLPHIISFWARSAGAALAGKLCTGLYNNMGWSSYDNLALPPLQNGTWVQYVHRVYPPANATTPVGELYVSLVSGETLPAGAALDIADVQVTLGSELQPWAGTPTVRAGDFIKVGGQLFQALDNVTTSAAGLLTVATVNRARAAIADQSGVDLERPTIECVLPGMSAPGTSRGRAFLPPMFDLEEA